MAMPFLHWKPFKKMKRAHQADGEMDHLLRLGAEYGDRIDLQWQANFRLPRWAQDDPRLFFQQSECHESEGRYWAFAARCSLARSLTRDEQIMLGWRFIEQMFPAYAGFAVLHEPTAADGLPQPHLHILYSARLLDAYERGPEQFFTRYNAQRPAIGGARKDDQVLARQYPGLLHTAWHDLMEAHRVPIPGAKAEVLVPAPATAPEGSLVRLKRWSFHGMGLRMKQ